MTVRAVRLAGLTAAALATAVPGHAAEPRSAIPWLSQSIEVGTPPPGQTPPADSSQPATDDTITVTALGSIRRDAVGLLPPETTKFARALWGPATAEEVSTLISAQPDQGVPAARALFRRVLLAEADAPVGPAGEAPVLLARIDRLLQAGALEPALALLDRAGPDTPELFRRWFDVGLLLDQAAAPCAALRQNPSLSPTLPARVFCLARGGDWNAAEITLTLGKQVGSIPADEQALLGRFLDPEIFEDAPEPPIPVPLTALDFLMREAVGLPRPPGPLPLAFLHADLEEHVPMRTRIVAAERLTLSQAVPGAVVFAAYRSGVPAASGGVWDRARAVQALEAALDAGDPEAIGSALQAADDLLAVRGLRVAFADEYAPRLARLDAAEMPADARGTLAELLLLGGALDAARQAAAVSGDSRLTALLAIADAGAAPAGVADPLLAAALAGLTTDRPADDRETQLAAMLAAGRQGEAILGALALLAAGPAVDPPALRAALLTLRLAGQSEAARSIAVQTALTGTG